MIILTSRKMPASVCEHFENVVFLPENPYIDERIAFHTDLSLFVIGKTIICAPFLIDFLRESLPDDIEIITGEQSSSPYPGDVKYNAALVGKTLYCNEKHTSKLLIDTVKKRGITVSSVSQGYAKCSVVPVCESALITSDTSIKNAAEHNGADVLLVSNDGVSLPGFPNGFIGGASVVTESEVVFTGDLTLSPDHDRIISFIEKHGKKAVYFKGFPLFDLGSPVVIV